MLSGKTVVFHTGVALVDAASGRCRAALVDVVSTFRTLNTAEVDAYLDREAPYDCAGSVKSEGLGIALFERIESDDPTALIGLPLIALTRLLREARRGRSRARDLARCLTGQPWPARCSLYPTC